MLGRKTFGLVMLEELRTIEYVLVAGEKSTTQQMLSECSKKGTRLSGKVSELFDKFTRVDRFSFELI